MAPRFRILIPVAVLIALISGAFGVISEHWEFTFLDAFIAPGEAQLAAEAMTPGQKEVHLWATWLLDVIYPLLFWALFGGLSRLGLPDHWRVLIWVPRMMCLTDLSENFVQTAILVGVDGLYQVKSVFTLLKFGSYALGAILAIIAIIAGLLRHVRIGRR